MGSSGHKLKRLSTKPFFLKDVKKFYAIIFWRVRNEYFSSQPFCWLKLWLVDFFLWYPFQFNSHVPDTTGGSSRHELKRFWSINLFLEDLKKFYIFVFWRVQYVYSSFFQGFSLQFSFIVFQHDFSLGVKIFFQKNLSSSGNTQKWSNWSCEHFHIPEWSVSGCRTTRFWQFEFSWEDKIRSSFSS